MAYSGPFLDVATDVLTDPMIAGPFVCYRRDEEMTDTGRASLTRKQIPAVGVITVAHGNDLKRLSDQQRMGRAISIVTQFMLQGPSDGVAPDAIGWAGSYFVIVTVDPYPQYGPGWIQAVAASMDYLDPPPALASAAGLLVDGGSTGGEEGSAS